MTKRVRTWNDGQRRQLLEELDDTGMSVAAFARERDISAWTIYSWRRQERDRKNRKQEQSAKDEQAEFIQVRVAPSPGRPAPLEVELQDGVRVHVRVGFDERELRRLLGVLTSC